MYGVHTIWGHLDYKSEMTGSSQNASALPRHSGLKTVRNPIDWVTPLQSTRCRLVLSLDGPVFPLKNWVALSLRWFSANRCHHFSQ